jgi:hypothetical protein
LFIGSWQLAVGSWQLAVGSWQLAVGSWLRFNEGNFILVTSICKLVLGFKLSALGL